MEENKQLYYYAGDLSITSPAIIKYDRDFNIVDILYFTYKKGMIGIPYWTAIDFSMFDKDGFTNMYRWDNFRIKFDKVLDFVEHPICFIVEASSYSSTGNIVDINQFTGGIISILMMKFGIPIYEYSPKEIKKFATGNGNADKPQMRKHLKLKFPDFDNELLKFEEDPYKCIRFKPPLEDITDSFWLGQMLKYKIETGELHEDFK